MDETNPPENDAPIPWKDHPAKKLLLAALRDGRFEQDTKPRAVFNMFKDDPAFAGLEYGNLFLSRLRSIKSKVLNDGLDKSIDWEHHPAKKFLWESFVAGTIQVGYSDKAKFGGPQAVWEQHCQNNPHFAGMIYDDDFKRRLKNVERYYSKKTERAKDDQIAYDIFRANHPIKTEGRWAGSAAQQRLKQDVAEGLHLQYIGNPSEMRDREDRPEYKDFSKQKFRDHIHQEVRLQKFNNYMAILNKSDDSGEKKTEDSKNKSDDAGENKTDDAN